MSTTATAPVTVLASSAPTGEVLAVCRVHALLPDDGPVGVTAIDKRPVEGPVRVRRLGLHADLQADRANHGGEDQAVYAYGQDDAEWWSEQLGYPVVPGLFGENLRVRGIPVTAAVVGERWAVGTALLEVTQPRTPCSTFARRLGEQGWVKRFAEANRTGAYLRVLTPGELRAGDAVNVCYRPEHGVTLADWYAAWTTRGAESERAAAVARRLLEAQLAGDITLSAEMLTRAETVAGHRIAD
ncbi:MOSC domain-containing protein [Cellulosimicrobium cellulans]|uniref:MOSC domain-containing protein n=1 Tax=Cellulosimicrobium cellulans TaxID=1710 RepID=UPI0008488BB8|nr:MOSC domain-containing protein [Cellulosimicrobium cellulans]